MSARILLTAAILLISVQLARAGDAPGGLTLVENGRTDFAIVLSSDASPSEQRGAAEIQSHLREITGAELPILTDAEPLPQRAILVGKSRHTDAIGMQLDLTALGSEGFVLKTAGNRLVIAGGRLRGTMYGCTTFLEKLGVRWLTPRVRVMPHAATLVVGPLDERQAPAFEYRDVYFTEAFDKDWAARLRTNGATARLDASTGGKVTYYPFVHSFDQLIPPSLHATNPEFFPLIGGKRKGGYVQRCLSNPEVLKRSIAAVRQWMAQHPQAMIYSVSQNDTGEWCNCDECRKIEAQYGGAHAGLYLWFVNEIARDIEKDYPDKLIDTLAYQFTEQTPTGIVPRRNVRVRLCPIAVCEAHPYEKCSAKPTVTFANNLKAWAAITDTLYIWHYNINFAHYLLPFPDFNQFPDSIRLYQRSGVKGIFFEGGYGAGGGASDAELRTYVMAKLLWQPSLNSDALVQEWMEGVYGAAARPMRQWFDLLHRNASVANKHFFIFDPPTVHYLSGETIAEGDRLFDEAQRLASGNAVASEYIAKARLGLRYVKISREPAARADLDPFLADLRKFGVREIREGQSVDAWEKSMKRTR